MSHDELDAAVRRVIARPSKELNPDAFRNWLAFFLISAFVTVLPLLFFKSIPAENKDIITYIVGQLSGMATMALGFYFTTKAGADALDAKRAETTSKAFEAITASANAMPIDPVKAEIVNAPDNPVPITEEKA
ncbi:hypothetical protein [Sphingobium sp. BS19]|uniref:hypothetical protein n=1 Tax=Sphingobium sp. BS19 TaxID=3018973 RepID=UPI0022EE07EA|nr:hypothetical protein [Sphingobium sp. BS19]GLI99107.1 hypothetical protein Sbs19_29250 [Sphingobium sp. BS19]